MGFNEHATLESDQQWRDRQSTSQPTNPPPKNMMLIETCSRSCAVHAPPQAARCSMKTFVTPYNQMTKDSVNSAVGRELLQDRGFDVPGLMFHAQPRSAKHPIQRLSVSRPYQKNMPPLTKCARPLKILFSRCEWSAVVESCWKG